MQIRILLVGIAVRLAVIMDCEALACLATADELNAPRTFKIPQDAFVTIQGAVTRSVSWAEPRSTDRIPR
ncbi:hypothetical protein A6A07_31400 [Streptomyces sp. CB03911]|nr:hypothetical protein A6A07_31400 [Streptomyces sp. CB03911]